MDFRMAKIILCILFTLTTTALASQQPLLQNEERCESSDELSYKQAILLGFVEGITEFLPISSTGHLILTNAILGLDTNEPVIDASGVPIQVMDEEIGQLRDYTIGEAAYAFVIVIQAGAIAAVIILYWKTLLDILLGFLGKSHAGRKLGVNLICAFLPAAVIGLLLDEWIESKLGGNVDAVAGALIVGAVVMIVVEKWRQREKHGTPQPEDSLELYELSWRQSVLIGLFQCIAMWPGTSRSMATIVGGYIVGLSPRHAAEFSFLLGFITLSAASGYKLVFDGSEMLAALSIGPVLVGCTVAFLSAALAVKWLVGYLSKHGLAPFAWYRVAVAIAVFWLIS